ncbi:MAG: MFS transporter, partial [Candidatus Lokiarchaeota archaeon]|nr:MFS transporter [Candidatus Lokiarchaeota archaeon]
MYMQEKSKDTNIKTEEIDERIEVVGDSIEEIESKKRFNKKWIVGMVSIWIALAFYGETEGQWFNSYITNPLVGTGYNDAQMSLMVSMSAIVGTIAFIFWASISDNLRSKRGRRVPIYIIGALSTALFVILFGQGTSLFWLVLCDGVIIGITSNMFHCTSRALIPDLFPKKDRGKINFFMQIGGAVGAGLIWGLTFLFKSQNPPESPYRPHQFNIIFLICAI